MILLSAAATASAGYREGYYKNLDGKSREELKAAAKEAVSAHERLNYTNLPVYWETTDIYPELYESSGGDMCKRWWEMYSNNILLILPGQNARTSFSANGMQREHSIPKSWWKSNGDVEYTPAYTDLWNLYPSDGPANQKKSNYPFGEVKSASFDNGSCKVGAVVNGQGGGSGIVFEPADEYKGDFARSCFYMATVYDDLPWTITYMYEQNSWPTLREWAVDMLLQWARMDPVSQKEIDRNEEVEKSQGNRNPFIDFPELAEYVWGTRTAEVFYLAEQGGQVTPPITGDPEITMPVNGEALDFGQVAVGMTTVRALKVEGSNLTNSLSLRLTGSDKNMFSLATEQIPANGINNGEGYLLEIAYTPSAVGRHEASLLLYDGGLPDGTSIRVSLTGEGLERPVLSRLEAYPATDITETSYTATWSEAPEVIDFYIVTRIRYYEDGAEAVTYECDENSIEFTDRDASVMESYSVVSSRLGIRSEASNSITVAAGSWIYEVEKSLPLRIGFMEGGFVVLTDSRHTNMRIYDMAGRIVRSYDSVEGGEMIMLPRGVYLILTDNMPHPLKVVVR